MIVIHIKRSLKVVYRISLLVAAGSISSRASSQTVTLLDFGVPSPSAIADVNGVGTGFTHRLPGTGSSIPASDPNLDVQLLPGYLSVISTRSDINQFNGLGTNLSILDAPGLLLSGIAAQNFRVSVKVDDVSVPDNSDQFVLYVGVDANKVVRGGFHDDHTSLTTEQFTLAGNTGTGDFGFPQIDQLGTFQVGDDVVLSLSRVAGTWSLAWDNLTTPALSGAKTGVLIPWLDSEADLYVGVMHNDGLNFTPQTAKIDYFRVAVGPSVPEPSGQLLAAAIGVLATMGRLRWRRLVSRAI